MTLQDEARALLAAATPAPWSQPGWDKKLVFAGDGSLRQATRVTDAALIARAPELLTALCDQLDQAEKAAADWKATAEDRDATIDEYREHAAAIAERAKKAEEVIQQVRNLADWHETKATKARLYPGAEVEIMQKAAQVHDDAARRLRAILEGGE